MKYIKVDVVNGLFVFNFNRLINYYNNREDITFIDSFTENQMYKAPFDYIDNLNLNPDIENVDKKEVEITFECNCNYADKLDLYLLKKVHYSWFNEMRSFLRSEDFKRIMVETKTLRKTKSVFPEQDLVLSAFLTDLANIQGVWIGESPYLTHEHANGIAFTTWSKKLPKTAGILINGIKEDLGLNNYHINNDFLQLRSKGILFLNYTLAITKKKEDLIEVFKPFIEEVIKVLNKKQKLAVILFGNYAKSLLPLFNEQFSIFSTSHPVSASYTNSKWDTNQVFKNFNKCINIEIDS